MSNNPKPETCKNGVCNVDAPQVRFPTDTSGPKCPVTGKSSPDGVCPVTGKTGDCPDGACPVTRDCPNGSCPVDNNCPDGSCPDGSCPDGSQEQPNFENIFASSLGNIHKFLAQSMRQPKQSDRSKSSKRSKKKHESDTESDYDSEEEDHSYSDDDGVPDYKWETFHQLLDSHQSLCTAFARLLDDDREDDEEDEE